MILSVIKQSIAANSLVAPDPIPAGDTAKPQNVSRPTDIFLQPDPNNQDQQKNHHYDVPPLLAGNAGNTFDPDKCLKTVYQATVVSFGWYIEIKDLYQTYKNNSYQSAIGAAFAGAMLFLMYKGLEYPTINPVRAWKNAWDNCGKPGKGLYDKIKAGVKDLEPRISTPLPAPTAASSRLDVNPAPVINRFWEKWHIHSCHQIEDWNPFVGFKDEAGLPMHTGALNALPTVLIDGVPTVPSLNTSFKFEMPRFAFEL